MRYVVLAAMLLSCAGCANRTISVSYNPALVDPASAPQLAEKECRKYGMVMDSQSTSFWTDYGRESSHFFCRRVDDAPIGWWTWPRAEF